jgi:hypothetical protein
MKALEELSRQKAAFDKKFEEDGQAALEAGFDEFFASNPGVEGVRWMQFTVGIDGIEDQVDGVADPVFRLVAPAASPGDDEEEEENEDAESDEEEDEEDDGYIPVADIIDPALRRACKVFGAGLSGHDELFYVLFDSGSVVTVTREGFEVVGLEGDDDRDGEDGEDEDADA